MKFKLLGEKKLLATKKETRKKKNISETRC
jgi:hypothetical protein